MTTHIDQALSCSQTEAVERFKTSTRAASFLLQLGIREIRVLQERGCTGDWNMPDVYLPALTSLLRKGLMHRQGGQHPVLSEAGTLTRHLLVLSGHIAQNLNVTVSPADVFSWLAHAASWGTSQHFYGKHAEVRIIDGVRHLVILVNEGNGLTSEWAVPETGIRRIG